MLSSRREDILESLEDLNGTKWDEGRVHSLPAGLLELGHWSPHALGLGLASPAPMVLESLD